MGQKVKELKKHIEREIHKNLPVSILPDKSIVYKKYRIKPNKTKWELTYQHTGDVIEKFNTKTSALLAAKFYDGYNFSKYINIKDLDRRYQNNLSDIEIYNEQIRRTSDIEKKDILTNRKELSEQRISLYREEIAVQFKNEF